MNSDVRSSSGRGILALTGAGLSLIAVSYGLARFGYGLFVPVFRSEFALDAATTGAIAAGSYVSYCVAVIIASTLTPRFGGRALAVAAGVVATVGVAMIAAAPDGRMLAAAVILAGASAGVASPPLAHAVAAAVPDEKRDRTQTVINAGTGVGVALAGPVALLTQQEWRIAWGVFAAVAAVATVWVAFAVPSSRADRTGPSAPSRPPLLPQPLLPPGSGRLIAAAALTGAASAGIWTFGRDVLVGPGGMGEQESTIAWILLGVFGLLGAVAGDAVRRMGIRRAWVVTVLVMGGAIAAFAAFPGSIALAWLSSAAFGATYIALSGLLLVWGTQVYPEQAAAGVGLAFLVIALGQAAGAPLIGVLINVSGAQWALAAAALLAVVAAFILPANRKEQHR